jgi:hypothetical protein
MLQRSSDPGRSRARVVDPFAGGGAYLRAAAAAGLDGYGSDIAPGAPDIAEGDWNSWRTWRPVGGWRARDVIVTNPPFTLFGWDMVATPDLPISLLLPINALEPTNDREHLFDARPPLAIRFIGRVRFGGPAAELRDELRAAAGKRRVVNASMSYAFVLWGLPVRRPVPTLASWMRPSRPAVPSPGVHP